jgi:hypothetical protein
VRYTCLCGTYILREMDSLWVARWWAGVFVRFIYLRGIYIVIYIYTIWCSIVLYQYDTASVDIHFIYTIYYNTYMYYIGHCHKLADIIYIYICICICIYTHTDFICTIYYNTYILYRTLPQARWYHIYIYIYIYIYRTLPHARGYRCDCWPRNGVFMCEWEWVGGGERKSARNSVLVYVCGWLSGQLRLRLCHTDVLCMYHVCTYVCMYIHTYVCMYVCMYIRMYVCIYIRMCLCI